MKERALARHYGLTAEELDFILNYDICLHRGFGREIKYFLGRDTECEE